MTFQPVGFPASRIVASIERRKTFPLKRENEAYWRAKAAGMTAHQAWLVSTAAAFDHACMANTLKRRVLEAIYFGTGHPMVRMRYGERAAMLRDLILPNDKALDSAIWLVDKWWRVDRRPLGVLAEIRLMLRLLRRSGYREHFLALLQLMDDSELALCHGA